MHLRVQYCDIDMICYRVRWSTVWCDHAEFWSLHTVRR